MKAKGFVVALTEDLRDEEVEWMATAIRQLRGVATVTPVEVVSSYDDHFARERVRQEWGGKVQALYRELMGWDKL